MTTEKDFLADLERLSGVTPEKFQRFRWDFISSRLLFQPDLILAQLLRHMRGIICTVLPSHHIVYLSAEAPYNIMHLSDEAVAFLNAHAQTIANLTMIAYNDEQLLSRS